MNFFERQDRSRRNTKLLVFLFVLAVIAVVTAVTVVVALAVVWGTHHEGRPVDLQASVRENADFLVIVALVTFLAILVASLVRSADLRGGGGVVARSMGGRLLRPDSRRMDERRLLNVVEEMAIASGVPVPEVYLLDEEAGINAFAAGFSPADAAIGVTRGAVDSLTREELQGVIAHEFSHILNGDMRLNQRLIGILFGILFLALTGQTILRVFRFSGRSRRGKGNGAAIVMMIALGLMIVGYIGVFFGRLIKAAVSRQREFLADASAVQFTRNPQGIGGALKVIAVGPGSNLEAAKTEEVSHMLFGKGRASLRGPFSTHPPLEERIRAIEPGFDPRELEDVAKRLQRRQAEAARATTMAKEAGAAARSARQALDASRFPLSPETLTGMAGTVDPLRLVYAVGLLQSFPDDVRAAAASTDEASSVVLALLLSDDAEVRAKQSAEIARTWGELAAAQVERLRLRTAGLGAAARLPLLDLALPSLRQLGASDLDRLVDTARTLILADDRVEPFEFALAKTLGVRRDAVNRPSDPVHGKAGLGERLDAARTLLRALAGVGSREPEEAAAAYRDGAVRLAPDNPGSYVALESWASALDEALDALAELAPLEKGKLVEAAVAVVAHDGEVTVSEAELLRAVCAALHVPVPPLVGEAFDVPGNPPLPS